MEILFIQEENPLDKIVMNLFERIPLGNDLCNQVTLKSRIRDSKKKKKKKRISQGKTSFLGL